MHLTSTSAELAGLLLAMLMMLLALPRPAAEGTRPHRSARPAKPKGACRCGCDGTCRGIFEAVSNEKLLADWGAWLRQNFVPGTYDTYMQHAVGYLDDLTRRVRKRKPAPKPSPDGKRKPAPPTWPNITPADAEKYTKRKVRSEATYFKGSHLSDNTKRTCISALRNLTKWAHKQGLWPTDLMAGSELPPRGRTTVRYIPWRLQTLILSEARSCDERLYVIVVLMLRGGLRCIEVARLRYDDVDLDLAEAAVRGKGYKGEVSRYIPLVGELAGAVAAYMANKPRSGAFIPNVGNDPGDHLDAHTLSSMVGVFLHSLTDPETGQKLTYSAHDLRHTLGKMLLKASGDPDAVRLILGHVTLTSTNIYTLGVDGHVQTAAEALARFLEQGGDALTERALRRIGATARHAGLGERTGDSSHLLGSGDHRVAARPIQQPNR